MGSDSVDGFAGDRVLYVDTSADSRAAVRAALDDCNVTAVETVSSALDALTDAVYDYVVSEYDLPDAEGAEGGTLAFCEHVTTVAPKTSFVFYTDAGDERVAGRAFAAGADGYVPKRDGVDTLVSRIDGLTTDPNPGLKTAGAAANPSHIVAQAPLALIEFDAAGDVVRWNGGATDLFGYTASEALGADVVELLVPEHEREGVEETRDRVLSEAGVEKGVNENVRKDGTAITCEWHNTTLTDYDGEITGVLSFVHDVTARENRKETIEQLRSVTRELVRVDDTDAVAEHVVSAAEEILGQPYSVVYLQENDYMEAAAASTPLSELAPVNDSESINYRAFQDGESTLVQEAVHERSTLTSDDPVESALVHPLGEHGTLALGSRTENAFDETDIQLSNILASATTAALDRTSREDELRLHETIVDAVGAGVFALDSDGTFQTVNETLQALSGYDREELVGESAAKLVGERVFERATRQVTDLVGDDPTYERVLTLEVDLQTADGGAIPCEVNVALLSDPEGREFSGVAGVVRDVRERKRMQSELGDKRRKIENLHDIASLLDDCETRHDVWRLTVEAAEGVLDFDVCGVDEVRGDYLHSVGLSSEIEPQGYKNEAHVSDGIAGKTHRTGDSFLFEDVQGDNEATPEKREYRSLISVPVGEHGVFQAVSDEVGGFDEDDLELAELLMRHVSDAIERLEFEGRLRSERDRFAALFENVPDPVVQVSYEDGETIVQRVNPAFERVFGYDPAEVVGENLNEFIVPVDRREEAVDLDDRGQNGQVVDVEVKRRTTDGLRDFELTAVPVDPDADEQSTYGVYSDITERKERQKRVEILNRVLRHDLRNGMNIIKGSAEMLQDAVSDSTAVGYADQVIERADDLLGLAEKTRAVERTLDRDTEATGPVSVSESVETSARRVREEYPHANIETALTENVEVRADDMLRTAIYHLIENAVEHNDRPDPSVCVSAKRAPDRDDVLCIRVSDDGPGIPDTERELIEEEREITQLRHASGLGLWLVDWVVNQSGGSVTFEENDPRGTTVTLHVPIATESDVLRADD